MKLAAMPYGIGQGLPNTENHIERPALKPLLVQKLFHMGADRISLFKIGRKRQAEAIFIVTSKIIHNLYNKV